MSDEQTPKNHFSIQKFYIKDLSLESPSTPQVFQFKQWDPKIDLNINSKKTTVSENIYEVVLAITVTVTNEEKTAFLIEVQQAGLFAISGFNDQELEYLLGSQCMNILFPYARELISDMTMRGGFPPLILSPVNFDALYQQHLQAKKDKAEAGDSGETISEDTIKH